MPPRKLRDAEDATVEPFHGGAPITLGEHPMSEENPEDIAYLRDT